MLSWVLLAWPSVPVSSQGVAVLGIALIAMGEEIGAEMGLRTFGHLVSDHGDSTGLGRDLRVGTGYCLTS